MDKPSLNEVFAFHLYLFALLKSIFFLGVPEGFDLSKINIAIFSAGSEVAKKYAETFVEKGIYVIDLSSEYRYDDDVPLVIPEINNHEIKSEDVGPGNCLINAWMQNHTNEKFDFCF